MQYAAYRHEIIQLYILDGRTQNKLQNYFDQAETHPLSGKSIDAWKDLLEKLNVCKNINKREVLSLMSRLSQDGGLWYQLVLDGNVLQDNYKIMCRYSRNGPATETESDSRCREFEYVPLEINFTLLALPGVFQSFRKLLFSTSIYFESSFDYNQWRPDNRGLYGRSPELRDKLSELSKYHNMIFDAVRLFKLKEWRDGGAILRMASCQHKLIVQNRHHQQMLYILAIMVLFQQNGYGGIRARMSEDLFEWARCELHQNDPRVSMFETLKDLHFDNTAHPYLAYNAFCRHIWMSRVGHNKIKAYYSYNQASWPRIESPEFYSLYRDQNLEQIKHTLGRADSTLGQFSNETFCLWHTAIHFLASRGQYPEMEELGQALCSRLADPRREVSHEDPAMENHYVSMTFFLIGIAQEAQQNLEVAMESFHRAVTSRVPDATLAWDAQQTIMLRSLESVATKLQHNVMANWCSSVIRSIYSAVKIKEKQNWVP